MKKIILYILLLIILAYSVFALPSIITSDFQGKSGESPTGADLYNLEYSIYKGWNLIPSYYFLYGASAGDISCSNSFKYGYMYDYENSEYLGGRLIRSYEGARTSKFENIYSDKRYFELYDNDYTKTISSMWIYSNKDCKLTVEHPRLFFTKNSDIKDWVIEDIERNELKKGWNFFSIRNLIGEEKLSEFFNDCSLIKLAIWDPQNQEWFSYSLGEEVRNYLNMVTIEPNLIDYTFLIKVEDDCKLSYSKSNLPPPSLP